MTQRWVKIWVKSINDPIFKGNIAKFGFWVWCISKAVTKDGYYPVGSRSVYLKRGQFVFGRVQASKDTGLPSSTITLWLKQFSSVDMVNVHAIGRKYSIVEVSKYKAYQDFHKSSDAHADVHDDVHTSDIVVEDRGIKAPPSNEAASYELPPELESPFGQDPLVLLEQLKKERELREQNGN